MRAQKPRKEAAMHMKRSDSGGVKAAERPFAPCIRKLGTEVPNNGGTEMRALRAAMFSLDERPD
jgi:hypothetical protein